MMRTPDIAGLFMCALSACEQTGAAGSHSDAGALDSGVLPEPNVEHTTPDLQTLGARALDSLDVQEARIVCEEAARRVDPCVERARRATRSPTECNLAVESCREDLDNYDATIGCGDVEVGPPGSCTVTVDAYFACIDDWSASLSCDRAGYLVAPQACAPVVDSCAYLSRAFFISGLAPLCTASEIGDGTADTDDDIHGHDGCRPTGARFVVLGDSIAACAFVPEPDRCSAHLIAEFIRSRGSPDLTFETHAAAGALVGDLMGQAQGVAGGAGHVFVWIWAIGNNLTSGDTNIDGWAASYQEVFNYFTDVTRFPDGATFLLNAQYRLDDECDAPGAMAMHPPELIERLLEANQRLFLDVAQTRTDAVAIDHYPDFLGHGYNANVGGCPHCGLDNTPWLADGLHPNEAGHAHIAEKWIIAIEPMVSGACGDGGT